MALHVVLMAMNPRWLANLIDQHASALVLYARQWCAVPEDVVQDAFLKLVQARRLPDDPVAWLFRVVRHAALDDAKMERRRKTREQQAPTRWFAEPELDGLDAPSAIAALEVLAAEQREVIVARLWGGLTLEQIAVVAECSVSSVHRRYEAGIAHLRKVLGVPCPTPSKP